MIFRDAESVNQASGRDAQRAQLTRTSSIKRKAGRECQSEVKGEAYASAIADALTLWR